MASNLTKLARITAVVGTIGAISLVGVKYASQDTGIQSAIDSLKAKALDWKNQAGLNKAELNKKTEEYNTLKANYDAVLEILGIDGAQDIEVIKQKVQDIYNNASATGIEGTNNTLKAIANALGVELTDADKNTNGVYKTDKIIEELGKLDDELDKLDEALGDLAINLESGDMEYSDDMTLTEKINYLIGQINKANDDQTKLKTYADEADKAVDEANGDYVVENKDEASSESNPGGVQGDAKAEAYANLSDNAKLFADKKYEAGDIVYDSSNRVCKVVKNASKYGELITTNPVTGTLIVSGNNSLTADDITALDNWASIK